MTTYGITQDGFVPKTLEVIEGELSDDAKTEFGTSVRTDADSALGQLITIIAERITALWELGESAYNSNNPDYATGQALDAVCALTGTIREAESYSTTTAYCCGTAATVITLGSKASVTTTEEIFESTAAGTLAAATAWAAATAYTVGDIVTNSSRIYYCITAGTSAGAGGPTTTALDITDNTAHWRYLGEGAAYAAIEFQAQNAGAVVAAAGDLATIETPISGWSTVRNYPAATQGDEDETDAELRIRREVELTNTGTGAFDSLRGQLLNISGVTHVYLFVNNTDATDGDGVPPHSVEALVVGGTDALIAQCLHDNIPVGIGTYGTDNASVTDDQGVSQTYYFTRATSYTIHVACTITYDATLYPTDGDTQVKNAVAALSTGRNPGKDVIINEVRAAIMGVAGLLDITALTVDTVDPPVASANIAMALRDLAVFSAANTDVTSGAATP